MDNFDYPAIGQRIKQLRKRKGLNQTELAQMLKKSLRTVQKYETGEIEVSIAVVNQIADLLDTTSTYILGPIKIFLRSMRVTAYSSVFLTIGSGETAIGGPER